jgi:16S rRNA (adenine1518-N6/adenine1519-N6)-dimethyltransferase
MAIYKPTELIQFLTELGISPKKGLSQNFLIDGNIIRKIVSTAFVEPGDVVLEIGPGPGALTEALLEAGATVLAVEKDPILAKALNRIKVPTGHLEVFCDDIQHFPIEEVLKKYLKKGQKAKVIANLPYHLTTSIVTRFVVLKEQFSKLVIMVQDEVARRYTSSSGGKEYGSITVFLNYYSNPQYAFRVSKNCFFPPPKIESAIVILELKDPPEVSDVEKFFILTRTAFEHRRKMLRSSLRELYPQEKITQALGSLGIDPQARPESLSLEHFIQLFEKLSTN